MDKLAYAQEVVDSGIFSIEEEDDGTFTILTSDGSVHDDGFGSYDAALQALAATAAE